MEQYDSDVGMLFQSVELSSKRDSLRSQKDSLKLQHVEAEQALTNHHRAYLDLEIRKLRRCKLLQFHLLEQNLLKEVSTWQDFYNIYEYSCVIKVCWLF